MGKDAQGNEIPEVQGNIINSGVQSGTNGGSGAETDKSKQNAQGNAGMTNTPKPSEGNAGANARMRMRERERERDDDEEDDELPTDDKGNVTLSKRELIKRAGRMSRSELRKMFGTDDLEKIKKDLGDLETLRKEKTEREKKDMSEAERLRTELKEKEKELERQRARNETNEAKAAYREKNTELKEAALDFVDKGDADDILDKLARAIKRDPDGFKSIRSAKRWIRDYVEANPKWAKSNANGEEQKTTTRKVPINNGAAGANAPKPGGGTNNGGGGNERTIEPGPNQMSKAELRAKFPHLRIP